MTRKEFIEGIALSAAAVAVGGVSGNEASAAEKTRKSKTAKSSEKVLEMRRKAAHRIRRVIVNNDGNDNRWDRGGDLEVITPELLLAKRSLPLAEAPVDTVFYCDGVTFVYSHRSKFAESEHRMGKDVVDKFFWDRGTDALQITTEYFHQHGKEVFWSMRMNDNHDSKINELLSQFKKDHPELLVGYNEKKILYPRGKFNCFDFSHSKIHDMVVESCREVIDNYDVDGIELDFFRHPAYFKEQFLGKEVTSEHCDMMTGTIRRIRKALDARAMERGRAALLAVRVPDSPEYGRAIGVDWLSWVKEGLVDLVIGGDYFKCGTWREFGKIGRDYNIPVYACLEQRRLVTMVGKDLEGKAELGSIEELWRDEAYAAWQGGVNGIYMFNRFDPDDPILQMVGNPRKLEKLKAVPRESYGNNKGYNDPGYWVKGGRALRHIPE